MPTRARKWTMRLAVAAVAAAFVSVTPARAADGMARVGPGVLHPFDPPGAETTVRVRAFMLDRTQVTNRQFLAFVTAHAKWQRGKVAPVLADESYLASWEAPTTLGGDIAPDAPVVRLSWFAAKAFCEARGARLPTEDEWELAADATEKRAHVGDDPARKKQILDWYAQPTPKRLPKVGVGAPNVWGVRDMHGLVWEWVYDFNTRVLGGDRGRVDEAFVCGGTALRARDKNDYASYMRVAFRASLRAAYTTANLGFRCAADVPGGKS